MKISPSFQWDFSFFSIQKTLGRSLRLKDSEAVPWRKWTYNGGLMESWAIHQKTVFFWKLDYPNHLVRWWLGCIITSLARYLGSITILSFGDWIPRLFLKAIKPKDLGLKACPKNPPWNTKRTASSIRTWKWMQLGIRRSRFLLGQKAKFQGRLLLGFRESICKVVLFLRVAPVKLRWWLLIVFFFFASAGPWRFFFPSHLRL